MRYPMSPLGYKSIITDLRHVFKLSELTVWTDFQNREEQLLTFSPSPDA